MKISAFYIAEQLNLKKLKEAYAGTLQQETQYELFYLVDNDKYFYAFDYGAVVFANMTDTDISQNLGLLQAFCSNPLPEKIRDDFEVTEEEGKPLTFNFNNLLVPKLDESVAKIVMLNTAHSVTMDFYAERAETLLTEVHKFTNQMEDKGTIEISRINMVKFIGRMLNNKNKIIENLFLFDQPDITWDDEYLDKIHRGLVRTFDLQSRFKEIEYTFKIIEDNLSVFRELFMHRESSKLEWIIIVLICIEVADLLISKLI
jgi:required for meiotic nuclear division protein 1